ncbi:hypothetical protein B14911_02464 [Bacillus sp. NRRL B-14911]|nr:hypothetical protein B14911_02464 [Bacillus sp. NRRL B-14911]
MADEGLPLKKPFAQGLRTGLCKPFLQGIYSLERVAFFGGSV